MLRAVIGLSIATSATVVVGGAIGLGYVLRQPVGRGARVLAGRALAGSRRATIMFETVQERMDDLAAEARALRADTDRAA